MQSLHRWWLHAHVQRYVLEKQLSHPCVSVCIESCWVNWGNSLIYIELHTLQIVSKPLNGNKQEDNQCWELQIWWKQNSALKRPYSVSQDSSVTVKLLQLWNKFCSAISSSTADCVYDWGWFKHTDEVSDNFIEFEICNKSCQNFLLLSCRYFTLIPLAYKSSDVILS